MFPTAPSVAWEARATVGDAATSTAVNPAPFRPADQYETRRLHTRQKYSLSVFPTEYGEGLSFNAS